jgi:hypothetical protein
MLRRLLDLLEHSSSRTAALDAAIDEIATDAATKLAKIAEDTARAEAGAARQELRLRLSHAVNEIDRLQRLRAARA